MGSWTVGKVGWRPQVPNSWFTVETGGITHAPGSNQLVRHTSGAVNSGEDPGGLIVLDADDRYVAVAAGVTLIDTGSPFFGDNTGGEVGWTSAASVGAGEVEAVFTIYDSSFNVLHEESGFNVGASIPPFYDNVAPFLLSTDFTMPSDGYVAVWLNNTSAETLTISVGSSIVLYWR